MDHIIDNETYKRVLKAAEFVVAAYKDNMKSVCVAAQNKIDRIEMSEEVKRIFKDLIDDVREKWERFFAMYSAGMGELADAINEIIKITAFCEQEKRRLRFFGCGKRDIFKKRVHIKRAIFQKPKYRKWRISVYGFYG